MKEKVKIVDESGDKKYFTIIPNYILNHSTLWDREVYIQMKRITGEDGACWTSQKTLAKQCGISVNRLKKSLKYLLEHGWIKQVGVKKVATEGGGQEVHEYKVSDLWKLNIEFYEDEGVSPGDRPITQRGITAEVKGVSPGDDKEEPGYKEEPSISKDIVKPTFGDENINKLIAFFIETLKGSLDGTQQENRRYCFLLLNRFKRDYPSRDSVELVQFLIARGLEDRFHAKNITNFKYLYYNAQKIIQSLKSDANKNTIAKIS